MVKNRQTLLLLGDILVLAGAFFIMTLIRFDYGSELPYIKLQAGIFAVIFTVWIGIFFIFDLYNLRRVNPNPRNIGLLLAALVVNGGLAVALFYFFPQNGITPKTNLAILSGFAFLLLVAWRRLFYSMFTSTLHQTIGVIGQNPLIDHLITELKTHPHFGKIMFHIPSDTIETITEQPSVDILIAEKLPAETLLRLSKELSTEPFSLGEAYETLFGKIPVSLMTDEKAIHVVTHRVNAGVTLITRIIEIGVALFVLIIASPVLLLSMIAIMLEDGQPILYRQVRIGRVGKHFALYKLRSMVHNAEKDGIQWAEKKDPRVTRVGRIIRKLHIDEIPQMINIIKGDIALVGPRPERPEIVTNLEKEIPYYFLRHTIRPGFTGWAQIKFRYARTVDDSREKFEYDLYYLLNRTPLLDVGIFLKTIQIIFTH